MNLFLQKKSNGEHQRAIQIITELIFLILGNPLESFNTYLNSRGGFMSNVALFYTKGK